MRRSAQLSMWMQAFLSRWCFLLISVISVSFHGSIQAQTSEAIEQQRRILSPYQAQIQQRLEAFKPLIHKLFRQLEQQKLPAELILLPMLESSYNANAISPQQAAGLWQLMPATAERFGLQVTEQNDQRFDIDASTQAALRYLSFLYRKFDQNLNLTLAAYNAGEGRVATAIKAAKSTDFSQLTLPKETQIYVSRFQALKQLIDVYKLRHERTPIFLIFGDGKAAPNQPLIDLTPLPPLISLP